MVLVYHLALTTPVLAHGGVIGVDVFFVISGYLITSILSTEVARGGRINLPKFYAKRAIRLWPALIVVVVMMLIPGLLWMPEPAKYLVDSFAALLYLTPVTTLPLHLSAAYLHTWTLGLEEYFYLVFPLVLIVAARRGWSQRALKRGLTGAGVGLLTLLAVAHLIGRGDSSALNYLRVGGIALGCALALALRERDRIQSGLGASIAGATLIVVAVLLTEPDHLYGFSFVFSAAGTCLLIIAAVSVAGGPIMSALSVGPLVYIGVISYELYLWHHVLRTVGARATEQSFADTAIWAYPLAFVLAAITHRVLAPVQGHLRGRFVKPNRPGRQHRPVARPGY